MKLSTPQDIARFHAEQAKLFPGARYGSKAALSPTLLADFETALAAGPEEAIQRFLSANPYLLQYAFPRTGHHGLWVFPKRMIRVQAADGTPGLTPDYLVAARNSLGFTWQIVEIKRYDTQFANHNGRSLSAAGQKAIVQCATYFTHFHRYTEAVRQNVGVQQINPADVIILIGDSARETEAQSDRRIEFEQLAPRLKIVSYDRIRRGLEADLQGFGHTGGWSGGTSA